MTPMFVYMALAVLTSALLVFTLRVTVGFLILMLPLVVVTKNLATPAYEMTQARLEAVEPIAFMVGATLFCAFLGIMIADAIIDTLTGRSITER